MMHEGIQSDQAMAFQVETGIFDLVESEAESVHRMRTMPREGGGWGAHSRHSLHGGCRIIHREEGWMYGVKHIG